MPAAKVGGDHGVKGMAMFDLAATNLVILLSDLVLGSDIALVVAQSVDFLLHLALQQPSEFSLLIKIFGETLGSIANAHLDPESRTPPFGYIVPSPPTPLLCPWSSFGYDRAADLLAYDRRLNMSKFLKPLLVTCHRQADRETLLRSLSIMVELARLSDVTRREAYEQVSALVRWLQLSQHEFGVKDKQGAIGKARKTSPLINGLVCDIDTEDVIGTSIVVTRGQELEDIEKALDNAAIGNGIDAQKQQAHSDKDNVKPVIDARIQDIKPIDPRKLRRASTTLATEPSELTATTHGKNDHMESSLTKPKSILPDMPMTADPLPVPANETEAAHKNPASPNAPLPPPPPPLGNPLNGLGTARRLRKTPVAVVDDDRMLRASVFGARSSPHQSCESIFTPERMQVHRNVWRPRSPRPLRFRRTVIWKSPVGEKKARVVDIALAKVKDMAPQDLAEGIVNGRIMVLAPQALKDIANNLADQDEQAEYTKCPDPSKFNRVDAFLARAARISNCGERLKRLAFIKGWNDRLADVRRDADAIMARSHALRTDRNLARMLRLVLGMVSIFEGQKVGGIQLSSIAGLASMRTRDDVVFWTYLLEQAPILEKLPGQLAYLTGKVATIDDLTKAAEKMQKGLNKVLTLKKLLETSDPMVSMLDTFFADATADLAEVQGFIVQVTSESSDALRYLAEVPSKVTLADIGKAVGGVCSEINLRLKERDIRRKKAAVSASQKRSEEERQRSGTTKPMADSRLEDAQTPAAKLMESIRARRSA